MLTRRSRPLLLGHRGVRPLPRMGVRLRGTSTPRENTIAAFEYAIAHGCDGFEFDLRYTLDRRPVLCHDPKLKRKEIAAHAHTRLEQHSGYDLPCFEQVLARFAQTAYLDIELKVAGNEQAIVQALRVNPPQHGYVVSSFLPNVLRRLHDIDPSLPLGYICDRPEQAHHWTELPISAFVPHHRLVSPRVVKEAHVRGIKLLTWTVNHREELLRLAEWDVDGLISDDPKLLAEIFPAARAAAAQ